MRRQIAILLALSALVLTSGACAGERLELIETRQVALSGYAYDNGLAHVADASLELAVELYAVHRRPGDKPLKRLQASGILSVGAESYPLRLRGDGPRETRPPCTAYYHTRHGTGFGGDDEGLLLHLSDDLEHAYGLVALDQSYLGITIRETDSSTTLGFGATATCFTDAGETIWEIYDFRDVAPSVVAVNLGSNISSLEKLQAHRWPRRP
jgi:hypothetical protein